MVSSKPSNPYAAANVSTKIDFDANVNHYQNLYAKESSNPYGPAGTRASNPFQDKKKKHKKDKKAKKDKKDKPNDGLFQGL